MLSFWTRSNFCRLGMDLGLQCSTIMGQSGIEHGTSESKPRYIQLKRGSRYLSQGGGPTENALVLLYDTLISRFQWM